MRWKLLVIASLAAAIIGCGLWCALVIGAFGNARALARSDRLLFVSAIIPLGISAYSGVFVYRHTAHRRKTQAAFTVILSLILALGTYLALSRLLPDKFIIPRNKEIRYAR